jgi:tRNA wybutosine-synthesizing protein 2
MKTPFEIITENCYKNLGFSTNDLELLPKKWELLGDVLILKLDSRLQKHWGEIAEVYAEELSANTVLRRFDKVRGIYRKPGVELIFGPSTDTMHVENKVKFKFNPQKVMFSSGNIDERIRISTVAGPQETVVDMFAGIGYLCLPMAVHSHPTRIIACELNPVAYEYLVENIRLNHMEDTIKPVLGDNRKCIDAGNADRIVMGYIKTEHSHREAALNILKPTGGIIHFHDVGFKNRAINSAFDKIKKSLRTSGFEDKFRAEMYNHYIIKSYGPKLDHIVLDIRFKQKS